MGTFLWIDKKADLIGMVRPQFNTGRVYPIEQHFSTARGCRDSTIAVPGLHHEQWLLTAPLPEAAASLRSPAAFFMIALQHARHQEQPREPRSLLHVLLHRLEILD
jgi:hypothetical protein